MRASRVFDPDYLSNHLHDIPALGTILNTFHDPLSIKNNVLLFENGMF
tara:strand:- start:132 stop:275 length:144 start_codon:yes stop_codon:yes gene_type:complete